ncbi:hypothetical protein LINPERPRIM_LOCUS193, partial [Linum perenne]
PVHSFQLLLPPPASGIFFILNPKSLELSFKSRLPSEEEPRDRSNLDGPTMGKFFSGKLLGKPPDSTPPDPDSFTSGNLQTFWILCIT